ncbi:MAG: response regulator [Dorea sp.]|nr:response regulator [Dorea sp.]
MYKVLIVEDDPMVAMINEQYVNKNRNFHVNMVCSNGKEGLSYLESHETDLVILDVYMPIMNGLETLKEIRSREISTDVIMVTAANDVPTLEASMHLGIVDYLVKPFSYDRFQDALKKFMALKTVRKESGKETGTLNQKQIDYIMETSRKSAEDVQPKGIQERTMDTIVEFMKERNGQWLTSDEIADQVSLSRVTVRRYMNHLMESGLVNGAMNYETGGRPCMMYKVD